MLQPNLLLVDGHLDLAMNALVSRRDLELPLATLRARERRTSETAMVTFPELGRGGIALVFATLCVDKEEDATPDMRSRNLCYKTQEEAQSLALAQLELYEAWEARGLLRIVKSVNDLEHHLEVWPIDRVVGAVLLLEGADPIVNPRDLGAWWRRGLRLIGLTWSDSHYAAGVGVGSKEFRRGSLTAQGQELLERMAELGFIWDVSHLAEEALWQGFELSALKVCATHGNPRSLLPTDRHFSDETMRELAKRQGVIGLTLYNGFLEPAWTNHSQEPVTLACQFRRHAAYVADLVGWQHVAIGSDLDGGVGLEESPLELRSVADLCKVGDVLPETARAAVLGGNWLEFLWRSLPKHS
jgi:membrane dipeptidase